jgi:hypothetical protein
MEQESATGLLTSEEIAPFETARQNMAVEIEEEADLIKIALLPDSISGRVTDLIARLEQLIKSKDTGGGSGDGRKLITIKKIKLFPSPRKIRTVAEWADLKKDMDTQITAALDQGDEVELF